MAGGTSGELALHHRYLLDILCTDFGSKTRRDAEAQSVHVLLVSCSTELISILEIPETVFCGFSLPTESIT